MEFGVFTNMYHPKHWRDGKVRSEHQTLRNELEYIELADRTGFKYSWSAEHHFLDEYSHLSASESFMAYAIARTTNIHVGSAIMNITAPVNHPARIAERVAMLDHLAGGRFEFGTGRGSSSTEVYGFGIESMEKTRELYDEALPQIVRM
jgi:alkanesulfonate monooxygenase SsuD/methylene tetrahydromethanopterin reductase-like flavin-dependent oxidoreductase (luciferase family)